MERSIDLDELLIRNEQLNNGATFTSDYLVSIPRSSPRSKVYLERTDDLLAGRSVVPQRVAVEVTFVV